MNTHANHSQPHPRAQIVRVSDAGQEISKQGARQSGKEDADAWSGLAARTRNLFLTKQGVETGPLPVMLHVKACTGCAPAGARVALGEEGAGKTFPVAVMGRLLKNALRCAARALFAGCPHFR